MTLNKKILAAAIVGGLFATAAQAQVNLSASTPAPRVLANEVNFTDGELALAADADFNLRFETGYAFSDQEVRYARIECSDNIEFTATDANITGTNLSPGNVNGNGTNIIRFSLTASGAVADDTEVTIAGTRTLTSRDTVSCTYSLYDLPSQAAAGGTAGRIASVSGTYFTFSDSYRYANLTNTSTANVEASPSFAGFVQPAVGSGPQNTATARIGQVRFNLNAAHSATIVTPFANDGDLITLAEILGADTAHRIDGDFSAAANSNGTFTGTALTRVFIASAQDCTGTITNANTLTGSSATFVTGDAAVNGFLCFTPRAGVAVPVSDYTITLVPQSETGYTASGEGPSAVGSIVRNGTSLQAQFAQVPAGWTSRIVLTNTGSVARPYTITAQTEAGVTATLGTAATGTVPANGTIVLNTADIATFTGQPRGTLNISVAAPTTQIQGLYQIVNGATGSIANTALVRPGTN
ncbi:hypothetical protein GCM10028794_04000 [Silanimonas algicola]